MVHGIPDGVRHGRDRTIERYVARARARGTPNVEHPVPSVASNVERLRDVVDGQRNVVGEQLPPRHEQGAVGGQCRRGGGEEVGHDFPANRDSAASIAS